MRTTLTIRTDDSLREALAKRAKSQGKSVSTLVREILEEAVAERPLKDRIGHLRGRLRLDKAVTGDWRHSIRKANWRRLAHEEGQRSGPKKSVRKSGR